VRSQTLACAASVLAVLAAASLPLVAAAQARGAGAERLPGTWCGGTRWKLMTLSDALAPKVRWTPAPTSIRAIAALPVPNRYPPARHTRFELQRWQVTLVIERYRLQSNGEIALELYDIPSSTYMNAFLPNPDCLSAQTRDRKAILSARRVLVRDCKLPPTYWWPLGASVRMTGVGYWNPVRTTLGALGNGAELRPVTGLKIINGCGHFG
jgi:hypothetical protein